MDEGAGRGGFTLLEILIAIIVASILAGMAVTSFKELSQKYGVEDETKLLYADLMDARGRAMQRNRSHFVRITANQYATFEDSSPAPDGNNVWDGGMDNQVAGVTVKHTLITSLTGGASNYAFNRKGIPVMEGGVFQPVTGIIRVSSTVNPDYDCITIRETRIKMGKYNAGTATCVEK